MRLKRQLTANETAVLLELQWRKKVHKLVHGYVTTVEAVPMGAKDDRGPWGGNPDRIIPPGATLKIVMVSRMGDFGLIDDLDADYGYQVRLDFEDAAITDIRLTKEPSK